MKILYRIFYGLVAIVAILVVISFFLPGIANVERSVVVAADTHTVFPYINDLQQFQRWSPWSALDPNTEYQFSDPSHGVGATMSWTSTQENVGSGRMEIIETIENEMVRIALDFGPMGIAKSYFFIEPVDGGSEVTWGFETDVSRDPVSRYMGLLYDNWIGSSYEDGLANLQKLVENETAAPS